MKLRDRLPLVLSRRTLALAGGAVALYALLGFFLATVLAGWALHTLVERPAMRHFGAREAPRLFRRTSQPQNGAL